MDISCIIEMYDVLFKACIKTDKGADRRKVKFAKFGKGVKISDYSKMIPTMVVQFGTSGNVFYYGSGTMQQNQPTMPPQESHSLVQPYELPPTMQQHETIEQAPQEQQQQALQPNAPSIDLVSVANMVLQFANGVNIWYMGNDQPIMQQQNQVPAEFNTVTSIGEQYHQNDDTEDDVISISDEEEDRPSSTIRTEWI